MASVLPSLWDSFSADYTPSSELLGYSRASLRDYDGSGADACKKPGCALRTPRRIRGKMKRAAGAGVDDVPDLAAGGRRGRKQASQPNATHGRRLPLRRFPQPQREGRGAGARRGGAVAEQIRLFDTVALVSDIPELGLAVGEVGAVVELLPDDTFEVEFCDEAGCPYSLHTLRVFQLVALHTQGNRLRTRLEAGLSNCPNAFRASRCLLPADPPSSNSPVIGMRAQKVGNVSSFRFQVSGFQKRT